MSSSPMEVTFGHDNIFGDSFEWCPVPEIGVRAAAAEGACGYDGC